MSTQLNNVGWAVLGTPAGFQSKNFGCISQFDIGTIVDVNNLVIKPFQGSELFCLYRELRTGTVISYYVLYNHAKEIRTDRPGTFSGSALVLVNHIVASDLILQTLRELLNSLNAYLTPDQRFTTPMATMDIAVPTTIQAILDNPLPLSSTISVGHSTGLIGLSYNNPVNQIAFFDFAGKAALSKMFNRIYATSNSEVIGYVKERGQIRLIDTLKIELEIEISRLKSELELGQNSYAILEKEKIDIESDLKAELLNLNNRIKEFHSENEDYKEKLAHVSDLKVLEKTIREKEREIQSLLSNEEALKTINNELQSQLQNERNRFNAPIREAKQSSSSSGSRNQGNGYLDSRSANSNNNKSSNSSNSRKLSPEKTPNSRLTRLVHDTRSIIVIVVIIIISVVGILVFMHDRFNDRLDTPSSDSDNSDQIIDSNPPATASAENKDNTTIKKKADLFYHVSIKNGNVYNPDSLKILINKLATADLNDDLVHSQLVSLQTNFALTNRPFDDVEKKQFNIDQTTESIKDAIKEIYNRDPKAKAMPGFAEKILLFNKSLRKKQPVSKGMQITYYVTK